MVECLRDGKWKVAFIEALNRGDLTGRIWNTNPFPPSDDEDSDDEPEEVPEKENLDVLADNLQLRWPEHKRKAQEQARARRAAAEAEDAKLAAGIDAGDEEEGGGDAGEMDDSDDEDVKVDEGALGKVRQRAPSKRQAQRRSGGAAAQEVDEGESSESESSSDSESDSEDDTPLGALQQRKDGEGEPQGPRKANRAVQAAEKLAKVQKVVKAQKKAPQAKRPAPAPPRVVKAAPAPTKSPKSGTAATAESIRQKLCAKFEEALAVGVAEVNKDGTEGKIPAGAITAKRAAEDIEKALRAKHGEVNNAYQQHFRSLLGALKDKENRRLRARVLLGEVSAERLCKMETAELLSEEQAEATRAKLAELERQRYLAGDDLRRLLPGVAAGLRDEEQRRGARKGARGEAPAHGDEAAPEADGMADPRGSGGEGPLSPRDSWRGADGHAPGDSARASKGEHEEANTPTAMKETVFSAGIDWATIAAERSKAGDGAQPVEMTGNSPSPVRVQTPDYDPAADLDDDDDIGQDKQEAEEQRGRAAQAAAPPPRSAKPAAAKRVEKPVTDGPDLTKLFLDGTHAGRTRTWTGEVAFKRVMEGTNFTVSVRELSGKGPLSGMLHPPNRLLTFQTDRVPLPKLEKYLTDLLHSRTRTVTIGAVSARAATGVSDEDAPQLLHDAITELADGGNSAFNEPRPTVEAYLIPPGRVASLLLRNAKAAARTSEALLPDIDIPEDLPANEMLAVVVHRKDTEPPPSWAAAERGGDGPEGATAKPAGAAVVDPRASRRQDPRAAQHAAARPATPRGAERAAAAPAARAWAAALADAASQPRWLGPAQHPRGGEGDGATGRRRTSAARTERRRPRRSTRAAARPAPLGPPCMATPHRTPPGSVADPALNGRPPRSGPGARAAWSACVGREAR
ncbi:unnamed protein product [Pedinophyceae sp. YPF-701]|nr:unnamed protein product [Pedinophyceae sp. YPF-701]